MPPRKVARIDMEGGRGIRYEEHASTATGRDASAPRLPEYVGAAIAAALRDCAVDTCGAARFWGRAWRTALEDDNTWDALPETRWTSGSLSSRVRWHGSGWSITGHT